MQIWQNICKEKAIPLNYISRLMQRCVERMEDVASSVRKAAFQLLSELIRNNPFGIKIVDLDKETIRREYEKEKQVLKELGEENDKLVEQLDELVVNAGTSNANDDKTANNNNKRRRRRRGQGRTSLSTTSEETDEDQEMPEDGEDEEEGEEEAETNRTMVAAQQGGDLELEANRQKNQERIIMQESKVNYLKDMLAFTTEIDAAIPKLCKMLFSKTQTDVLEV